MKQAKPMQSPDLTPLRSSPAARQCGAKTRNGSLCRTWLPLGGAPRGSSKDLRIPADALSLPRARPDATIVFEDLLLHNSRRCGERVSAWRCKQNSSGGKERLGGISRAGNRYLRQMLVIGAMAVIRHVERHGTKRARLIQLLARRAKKVAAVALANKTARTIDRPAMSGPGSMLV